MKFLDHIIHEQPKKKNIPDVWNQNCWILIIHDESGFVPLAIFGDICDIVKCEKSHDICNLSLSKYKSDHILKTLETMKLKEIDDLNLNVEKGVKLAKT